MPRCRRSWRCMIGFVLFACRPGLVPSTVFLLRLQHSLAAYRSWNVCFHAALAVGRPLIPCWLSEVAASIISILLYGSMDGFIITPATRTGYNWGGPVLPTSNNNAALVIRSGIAEHIIVRATQASRPSDCAFRANDDLLTSAGSGSTGFY